MDDKKSIFEKLRLIDRVEKDNKIENSDENTSFIDTTKSNKNEREEDYIHNEIPEASLECQLEEKFKREIKVEPIIENELITVDEIYKKCNINDGKLDTVFLIDSYMKALPENLPTDIKKQSVINIIKASNMDISALINDGINRLDVLDTYTKEITRKTEDMVKDYEEKIQELYNRINEYKFVIEERNGLQEEQKASIDYEVQKIENIIKFIK